MVDCADQFNGTACVVTLPNTATLFALTNFTLDSWVNFSQLPSSKGAPEIIALQAHSVSPFYSYQLSVSVINQVNFTWIKHRYT